MMKTTYDPRQRSGWRKAEMSKVVSDDDVEPSLRSAVTETPFIWTMIMLPTMFGKRIAHGTLTGALISAVRI
jgi:hypothetical protein